MTRIDRRMSWLRSVWAVLLLWGGLLTAAWAAAGEGPLDLATINPGEDLVSRMQVMTVEPGKSLDPARVQELENWVPVADNPGLIEAPREHSRLWLKASLANSSPEPVRRWLEVSPWRLNTIDAWIHGHGESAGFERFSVGLDTPVEERAIREVQPLIPVTIPARGDVTLLLEIESDSRPFLSVASRDPVAFTANESKRYLFHTVLLAIIATLAVVLALQLNLRYLLVSLWMLSLFLFEAEKEGYVSYLLLDGVSDYAANLRFSSSVVTKSLFMILSVHLLGLSRHRVWRWLTPACVVLTLVYSGLTFLLDGVAARQLAVAIHVGFALLWPLMLPVALKKEEAWLRPMALLLGIAWATSTTFVSIYVFNLDYSGSFDVARIAMDGLVALSLLLVYGRQKRDQERRLEQRLVEQERKAREQLEQAVVERTKALNLALDDARRAGEARNNFLGQVTHDLKNPLASIVGYARMLQAESGKAAQMSHMIDQSANHMLNLVGRLIDYARDATVVTPHPEDIRLVPFLEMMSQEARIVAATGNNEFELSGVAALAPSAVIRADRTMLREILQNLLDNAGKYTRDGLIRLGVEYQTLDEGQTSLVLTVSDTGCGIPPSEHSRLFDPFYRVADNRAESGSGLGLAIVKELVTKMNGRVKLVSEPGVGTLVKVTLPGQGAP